MTELQHVSYAVHDALGVARRMREEYGAVPVAGESLPEFRYVLLYVGTAERGGFLELMEPAGDGFLSAFLAKHGEGPHHLTWMVSDLPRSVAQLRDVGVRVVGESYGYAPWQEAFIAPQAATGCVLQIAHSDRDYPPPTELLNTRDRRVEDFPISEKGRDRLWWSALWDVDPGPVPEWQHVRTTSSDLDLMTLIYADVLEAQMSSEAETAVFTWAGGSITVESAATSGIRHVMTSRGPLRVLAA